VRQLTFSSAVRDGRGFTLVEMLIVVAIIGILASMAVAAHKYARMRGGEVAAVAALDAINKAQVSYRELCGNHRFYAPTLASLGVPMPGGSAFLSPDLAQADPLTKTGYVIRLTGTMLTIGRTAENDIALPSKMVSRHHARLLIGPNGIIVEDAGSTNGCFVNGEQVRQHLMHDNDVLELGDLRYRLRLRGSRETAVRANVVPLFHHRRSWMPASRCIIPGRSPTRV